MGRLVVAGIVIVAGVVLLHLASQDTLGAGRAAWDVLRGQPAR